MDAGRNEQRIVPDYAPAVARANWLRVRRVLLRAVLLGVVAGYVYLAFFPAKWTWHICSGCGVSLHMREYRLPLTPIPIWRQRAEQNTRLSAVMRKHGLPAGHVHSPVSVHGGEKSILGRATFSGRNQMATNAHDMIQSDFLDHLLGLDRKAGERWAGRILTQSSGLGFAGTLIDQGYLPGKFTTKEQFAAWWGEHEQKLEEAVRDATTGRK